MSSASTAAELMAKLGEAETYIAELERALHRATGVPVPSRPARHKYEAALPLEIGESDGLLAFLNSLSHLSFVLDMEGNILQINDAVTARLGFTTEELIGQSILMVHPPERRAEAARIVQAILADEATQCVAPLLTKDGRRLPVETHIVKGLWRGRSVIFGVTKDLSEMAAAEERFRAVFHDSPAPMAISDVQTGAYIEVNAAFLHMSGYARNEVVGKTALALSIFLDSAQRDILLARMKVQGRLDGENLFVQTKAGEVRHGIFSANYIEIAGHICLLTVMNDVTVRQQAEDELRRNRERYRALVDALDVALCRWRPDTTLTFTNEKYRVIFGIHGDAIGQKWLQFVPDATRAATTEFYRQLAAAPETVSYEHPVTVDEGQVRYYHWIDTPIFDVQGELVEFQSVGLDITDRKEAEDTLREKQAVLQEAQTVARLQSWYADFQTGLVTISPGYEAMSGWSAGTHPVSELIDLTFSVDLPRVRAAWKNAAATGQVDVEYRLLQKDEMRWMHVKASVTIDAEGKLLAAVGIAQDITARKQAELLIHAQRDLARILHTATAEAEIWPRCLAIARQVADMDCGGLYLLDETNSVPILVCNEGVTPDFVESAVQYVASAPNLQKVLKGEPYYFCAGELAAWPWCEKEGLRSAGIIPFGYHDQVLGCINLGSHVMNHIPKATRDALETVTSEIGNIVTYLRTEAKLRQSEERYRLLAENMRDVVWANDLAGDTTYFSPSVQRLWGYTPEAIMQFSPDALSASVASAWLHELSLRNHFAAQTLQPLEFARYDLEVRHQDGHTVLMEVLTNPMVADGAVIGLLSSARDVTENRAMAQEIRRLNTTLEERVTERTAQLAQALEELKRSDRLKDEFLAAMSHELRTPMTGIIGIADALALQTRGPLNERQQRQVVLLQESSGRMLKLINDLLRYASLAAGKVKFRPQLCLLTELCALSVHKIATGAQRKQLFVACSVTPHGLNVVSDIESIVSMVDALLDNAVKFTPAGGSITLAVEEGAEHAVRISVTDTGVGIAPEQMASIFHPFVQGDGSLSRAFEGLGLGLAYVGRMAAALGGEVQAESELGKGSRFTITLPQRFPPEGAG